LFGVTVSDPDGALLANPDMNASSAGCGGGCNAKLISAIPTRMRFGRLRVNNGLGSPLLELPLALSLEYWNGTGFVTNALDSCTTLTNTSFAFGSFQGGVVACNTSGRPATVNGIAFSGGRSNAFRLSPPGNIAGGSVDLTLNLGASASGNTCSGGTSSTAVAASRPWLLGNWGASTYDQNPRARAVFGRFTNSPDIIYLRENY
jgi:MSHA biogenesis protein MshQ